MHYSNCAGQALTYQHHGSTTHNPHHVTEHGAHRQYNMEEPMVVVTQEAAGYYQVQDEVGPR